MIEQLGQIILSGIQGVKLSDEEADFISSTQLSGIILFGRNYESPEQLVDLINQIRRLNLKTPPFIAVDHEGGRVFRFKNTFTHFPAMNQVVSKGTPSLCFEIYQAMAHELKAFNINLNFAPVCDLLTNPQNTAIGDRSFGSRSDQAIPFITAAIKGLQSNGVMGCAKHFPGHGNTSVDSHYDLPVVEHSLAELKIREILPFQAAIKNRVAMLMMSHLLVRDLDSEYPCTLSSKAYSWARKEFGPQGVIVTDDMEMEALTKRWSIEEAAVKTFYAGADLLIYRSMSNAKKAYLAINRDLQGHTEKNLLSEKYGRISKLKQSYIPNAMPLLTYQKSMGLMRTAEHLQLLTRLQQSPTNE